MTGRPGVQGPAGRPGPGTRAWPARGCWLTGRPGVQRPAGRPGPGSRAGPARGCSLTGRPRPVPRARCSRRAGRPAPGLRAGPRGGLLVDRPPRVRRRPGGFAECRPRCLAGRRPGSRTSSALRAGGPLAFRGGGGSISLVFVFRPARATKVRKHILSHGGHHVSAFPAGRKNFRNIRFE